MTEAPNYARPPNTAPIALAYVAKHPSRYVFPLAAGKKGRPCIKNNLESASNDAEKIKKWARQFPGCAWGCSTKKSGIVCVDIDCGPGKEGRQSMEKLAGEHGALPETETQRSPSGGYHKIFKGAHHFSASKIGLHIDTPNYFVIAGCTRDDGKSYTLLRDIPAAPLPSWIADKIKPRADQPRAESSGEPVPLDLFKKMLAATPYTDGPAGMNDRHNYEGWLAFAMACHEAAGGDEGDYLYAFVDWCLDDPNAEASWSAESIERHWQSFTADPPQGQAAVTRASWFKVLHHFGRDDLIGEAGPGAAEDFAADQDFTEPPSEPVFPEPISIADLLDGTWPMPRFTVDGWVLQGMPNSFNADGGTGKTTVSTQFGLSVAAGAPVLGRETIQAPVLLMLSEDDEGVTQARIKAAAERLKLPDPRSLPLFTWCLPGYDVALARISDQGVIKQLPFYKQLDERMASMPGCFVVLDSLVDVVQLETSDPAPANAFFKRLLTPLCQRHDATILVLAHPSKASMQDGSWSHGSLAFKNAVRHGIAMRSEPGQPYRILWPLKHNYTDADETKLYFEYPLFTTTPPSASDNPKVRRDAAILEFVVDRIREAKINVTNTNQSAGLTPRMIADQLNTLGSFEGTIKSADVQRVMVEAERNGVLKYHRAHGKTQAHYEWLGEQEPDATDNETDFQ